MIVGIDPGTTVGWALIDFSGKIIASGSQKEFSLNQLVSKVSSYGKIYFVGCDKAKIPSFVDNAAIKLGAKVINPKKDLLVDEKRVFAEGFKYRNSHEMDSLASAVFALRKASPLLNKVNTYLAKERKLSLFNKVLPLVVKNNLSIYDAIKKVETPELKRESIQKIKSVQKTSEVSQLQKTITILRRRAEKAESQFLNAKIHINKLKEQLSHLVKPRKASEIARVKQREIFVLKNKVKLANREKDLVKSKIKQFENALLDQKSLALPKISRLSWGEVKKLKNIPQTLFVENANEISDKAIQFLHEKNVQTLVCKKVPSQHVQKQLPFHCIKAQSYKVLDNIILVKKSWLTNAEKKKVLISELVEEYRQSR